MNTGTSSNQTTTQNVSPQEQQLIQQGLQLVQQQLSANTSFGGFQNQQQQVAAGQLPGLTSDLGTLTSQAGDANDLFNSVSGQYGDILQQELSRFSSGNLATPEELQQIDAAIGSASAYGNSDIDKSSSDALSQLRDELAPQLGLKPTDTPILDRGGKVEAEALRQKGQLATSLAGQKANSILNLPVNRSQILTNTLGLLQNMDTQRSQLAESAFINRLRLLGQVSGTGLGFATGVNSTLPSLTGTIGSTTTGSSTSGSQSGSFLNFLPAIGQGIGGVGGLLSGAGDLGLSF